MTRKPLPSSDYLNRTFTYNPETGFLYWKHRDDVPQKTNTRFAGKVVGTPCGSSGLSVRLNNLNYPLHRIIYSIMTNGDISEIDEIDHIDCDPFNNKWCNIRKATRSENCANRNVQYNSLTQIKGVGELSNGKFRARISGIHLGCFNTAEEAIAAYNDASVQLYGEFGRPSLLP